MSTPSLARANALLAGITNTPLLPVFDADYRTVNGSHPITVEDAALVAAATEYMQDGCAERTERTEEAQA